MFSARFDKQVENYQIIDEIELYINLNDNQKLTNLDTQNIDVRSRLEKKMQNRETTDSGWIFDKNYFNDKLIRQNYWKKRFKFKKNF